MNDDELLELEGEVWHPTPVVLRLDQVSDDRAVLRVVVGDRADEGTVVAKFTDRKRGRCGSCGYERRHVFVPVEAAGMVAMCGQCWLRVVMVRGFVGQFQ